MSGDTRMRLGSQYGCYRESEYGVGAEGIVVYRDAKLVNDDGHIVGVCDLVDLFDRLDAGDGVDAD